MTRLAQAALLYGRAYGKWEAGKIATIELPDAQNLLDQVAADPELGNQLEELHILAQAVLQQTAGNLLEVAGRVHASDVLSRWEGFGRFCREMLGMAGASQDTRRHASACRSMAKLYCTCSVNRSLRLQNPRTSCLR